MRPAYSGHTVLITGGSCDMALSLARCLIDAGLFPVLGFRNPHGQDKIGAALSQNFADKYACCELDFTRPETFDSAVETCGEGPDYLVDFAQGDLEALVASADDATVARYFQDNVIGRTELLKKVSRRMIRNRFGRLIFVSSAAAFRPAQGQGFYAASKRAVEALYTNIALELGARGITAMSLRPGFVDAGRGKAFIETRKDRITRHIPSRRLIEPWDVAESLCFLLSDAARGFNATELVMDGGLNAGKPNFV